MPAASVVDTYVETLVVGNRKACRQTFSDCIKLFSDATETYFDLIWPVMEKLERLYRNDRINQATQQMATRIHRTLTDQCQGLLPQLPANGKRILITCADGEPEDLGAQMCADLFEARGWDSYFVGGGVPNDEVLSLVGELRPDILLVFGTQPAGVPQIRALIDLLRAIAPHPSMNIMVSGGVFNRAEGLWKEVGADLFARSAKEAIPLAETATPRAPEVRLPGAPKKRRRRRRAPLLATAAVA
jgi:methanogenic corrinoid protein MtbC1